ncbi:MAG: hypothetical protein WAU55_10795 [Dehalococcoidales bacterium]
MDKLSNSEEIKGFLQDLGIRIDEAVVRQVVSILSGKSRESLYSLYARGKNERTPLCGKGSVYKIKKLFDEERLQPYLDYVSKTLVICEAKAKQIKETEQEVPKESRTEPALEKRIDPLIEEAQKEHMAEIRGLIEEWRDRLYTPAIAETVPDYHHSISDVQHNHLFEHLKEHLPSPTLWLNYTIWADGIGHYLFNCKQLIDDIKRDHGLWDTGYRIDRGELVWVGTEHYAFGKPILKRISDTALENRKIDHDITFEDFLVDDDQGEKKISGEVGEDTKTYVMYVDTIPVGRCLNKQLANETYKTASDYHLKEAEYVVILFRELKSLQDKIHKEVEEVLAYQDYRWYTCKFCKDYHFPQHSKQRWPQWTADNIYPALVEEHFNSLVPTSKELSSRLKILVSFREKWIDKGIPTIEGNIVDGCYLANPHAKKYWSMQRSEFPDPLDNSRKLDIYKPIDSRQAQCLLEHFNEQFPQLDDYNYLRMLNFTNLQPKLLKKMCSWLENEEFRQYGCYVCALLKDKFSS